MGFLVPWSSLPFVPCGYEGERLEGIRQMKTFNKIGSVLSDRVKTLTWGGDRKLRPGTEEEAVSFRNQATKSEIHFSLSGTFDDCIFVTASKSFQLIEQLRRLQDNNRKQKVLLTLF